jgi:rhodanese-related sulfurtransferase
MVRPPHPDPPPEGEGNKSQRGRDHPGGTETDALEELSTQLLRIGYDQVGGYLAGGLDAWKSAGYPVTSYPVAEIDDLCRACLNGQAMKILDVRQQREWDQGHIPEKSLHIFVGDLSKRLNELPRHTELWAICASGYRRPRRPAFSTGQDCGCGSSRGAECQSGRRTATRRQHDLPRGSAQLRDSDQQARG